MDLARAFLVILVFLIQVSVKVNVLFALKARIVELTISFHARNVLREQLVMELENLVVLIVYLVLIVLTESLALNVLLVI